MDSVHAPFLNRRKNELFKKEKLLFDTGEFLVCFPGTITITAVPRKGFFDQGDKLFIRELTAAFEALKRCRLKNKSGEALFNTDSHTVTESGKQIYDLGVKLLIFLINYFSFEYCFVLAYFRLSKVINCQMQLCGSLQETADNRDNRLEYFCNYLIHERFLLIPAYLKRIRTVRFRRL